MDFSSRYFWLLDNELPLEVIRDYLDSLGSRGPSALLQQIRLIEARVPVSPKAYLTSDAISAAEKGFPEALIRELDHTLSRFESLVHLRFASQERPLLVTVRSDLGGAIRNLGCNPAGLRGMIHDFGRARAYSLYIGFLESFSTLALGSPHIDFKNTFGIGAGRDGSSADLGAITEQDFLRKEQDYRNLISQKLGQPFPEKPTRQLMLALQYAARMAHRAGGDEVFLETQFPQLDDHRAAVGVVYTRHPFTGKKELYGNYQTGGDSKKKPLEPASGEEESETPLQSFRDTFPQAYTLVKRHLLDIEAAFNDVIEAQFVVDADGHLCFTHFDRAQTTAKAAVTNSIELNLEGKLSDRDAALRIRAKDVEVLMHPTLDDRSRAKLKDIGSTGATAAPGTAAGHVFFTMAEAMEFYRTAQRDKTDKRVILVADELLISDTPGLGMIQGLVTRAAGIASHAAVMARANGIPCIVGYKGLEFSPNKNKMIVNGTEVTSGSLITLEAGAEGRLFRGEGTLQNLSHQEGLIRDVAQLFTRVIQSSQIPFEVRVNINSAKDAETGLHFGADGVGLCRTENMFMAPEALREIRNIVFTQDPEKCADSFPKLEEMQFEDFKKIFEVMRGRTVNIRLMDLPLHDFVPQTADDFKALEKQLSHLSTEQLRAAADELREHNPMLGLRACRFGIIKPQVYNMQLRAIVRAAYAVASTGIEVRPGIMFPLVFTEAELSLLKSRVAETEKSIRENLRVPHGSKVHFKVGSMIELPAAALNADHLARIGEFFAFGTNDLTQTTLGMSRDDSAHYLPAYLEKGILQTDPFKVLADPVRQLVEIAVSRGKRVRSDVSFGICGEQGGDPTTLEFSLKHYLNYVSCSPFRVLPTKVALLHAAERLGYLKPAGDPDGERAA
jgi:pyruvate,orthophosphate dikinase